MQNKIKPFKLFYFISYLKIYLFFLVLEDFGWNALMFAQIFISFSGKFKKNQYSQQKK